MASGWLAGVPALAPPLLGSDRLAGRECELGARAPRRGGRLGADGGRAEAPGTSCRRHFVK